MGMFLIIWDKIFGTFQEELADDVYQPKQYGLTTFSEKDDPTHIIFHEWKTMWEDVQRKDIDWKDKLQYIIGPPGWSHDGSRFTSEQLKSKESGEESNESSYNTQPV